MNSGLIDLRYPFNSLPQFLSGGYYSAWQASHLLIAWIGILIITVLKIAGQSEKRLFEHFAVLSVIFAPYSNPAFMIYGLSLSDIFGLLTVVVYVFALFLPQGTKPVVPWIWVSFWVLIAVHSLFVFSFYDLGSQKEFFQRSVLVARPLMAVLVAAIVFKDLKKNASKKRVYYRLACFSLSIAAVVYVWQSYMFQSGIVPYGTMPSAGFGGVRFGGVSNEGGHLAKLSFPVLVTLLLTGSSLLHFAGFFILACVFLLNISATGYVAITVLFAGFLLLKITHLISRMPLKSKISVVVLSAGFMALAFNFSGIVRTIPAYSGLLYKLEDSLGQAWSPERDIYGRSPLIAKAIIDKYPLGIGYAGSTQRNIVMSNFNFIAKENNLGINVAVASWSVFSLLVFIFLLTRFTISWVGHTDLQKTVLLSLISLMAIDVLWSSPSVYLALFLAASPLCDSKFKSKRINESRANS